MREFRLVSVLLVLLVSAPSRASAQTTAPTVQAFDPNSPICQMIHSAARANALPVDFFARLIWVESRFRPDEIGPSTRTGERAQGIAQFMPGTAMERFLSEPFNPVEALPKSGEFLAELRDQFGNLGLAAAAYNAGPQRVRDFMAGLRELPMETRNYVLSITGRPIEDWVKSAKNESDAAFQDEPSADADGTTGNCGEIVMFLSHAPNLFAAGTQRWVPSWCRYLHQPNTNICGSVHEEGSTISTSSLVQPRAHLPVLGHHRADTPQLVHDTVFR
jgi:transglycosylase-like protein with SLT domain